jgi:hypothetical protein
VDLKNAAAVCLISLFSATLVVLIARWLDVQAAGRIEPQLAQIAEELQAIRAAGGGVAASNPAAAPESDDALMVYYFHGVRCPTCRAAEAVAHETLQTEYAPELARGEIVWRVLDYLEDPKGEALARDFDVSQATVVLARMKDGRIDAWNRLDRVLALAGDRPALAAYVEEEVEAMLHPEDTDSGGPVPDEPPSIPVPGGEPEAASSAGQEAASIPLP